MDVAHAAAFRDEVGSSMTRFALRFPLNSPLVASVIVGLNTAQQVKQVAAMMDGVEPRLELVERVLAFWREGSGEPA